MTACERPLTWPPPTRQRGSSSINVTWFIDIVAGFYLLFLPGGRRWVKQNPSVMRARWRGKNNSASLSNLQRIKSERTENEKKNWGRGSETKMTRSSELGLSSEVVPRLGALWDFVPVRASFLSMRAERGKKESHQRRKSVDHCQHMVIGSFEGCPGRWSLGF